MTKRIITIVVLSGVALLAAACSSSTPSTTTTTKPSSTVKTTSSKATNIVTTATVTVAGKPTTVLTNLAGYTLYYFLPDTSAKSACTASTTTPTGQPCSTIWPALTLSSGTPSSTSSLSGTLTTVSDGNGMQVEYNGHPLYRYSLDSAPHQSNGEGVLGKWFVATPTLPAIATTSPVAKSTTTTTYSSSSGSSSSGY